MENSFSVPITNDFYEIDVVADNNIDDMALFNTEHQLNNSLLLYYLIRDYGISGNYRLIITGFDGDGKTQLIDNTYTIDTARRFWTRHELDFKVDSPHYLWNQEDYNGTGVK